VLRLESEEIDAVLALAVTEAWGCNDGEESFCTASRVTWDLILGAESMLGEALICEGGTPRSDMA
jgi:hypothetical protein